MTTTVGYPFSGQSVSEGQFAAWAPYIGLSGLSLGGIVRHMLNEASVYADSSGMQVKVRSGTAIIQGAFWQNPSETIMPIAASHATLDRIDLVVAEANYSSDIMAITVVTGTPAGSPAAPALTRDGTKWQMELCEVLVSAAVSTIAAGKITDKRFDQSLCGYASDMFPCASVLSTARPSSWPIGGFIYETDTNQLKINGGTYTVPVWNTVYPQSASFAVPAVILGTAAAAGVATTAIRSDSTIVAFDATVPSTQAFGDAAAAGAAAVAARRDHKHAMPANPVPAFAAPTIALSTAAAAGAAATIIRSDATIAAFDATVPVTQAFSDAAATGSAAFAARRDHVHGMPASPASGVTKVRTTTASKVNNTLANDDTLLFAVGANEVWTGHVLCVVYNAGSNTPDFKWSWANPAAGTVYSGDVGMAVAETTTAGNLANVAGLQANNTGNNAAIATPTLVLIYFTYVGGANAGTVNFQWAQANTDAGNATQLRIGSALVAQKV